MSSSEVSGQDFSLPENSSSLCLSYLSLSRANGAVEVVVDNACDVNSITEVNLGDNTSERCK